jgi:ATP-dependent DNA helicase RecQ
MTVMDKRAVLRQYFGYESFREGQERIIDSILSARDCLCVMPTGAGKSLCFQVPALAMPGITLVISPLISLMKDQVSGLAQAGVRAAYINSSLTERQIRAALDNAAKGLYKIIYVAPERLEGSGFIDFAARADISMVTVDEAHCISQWGQDFRPSYLKIVPFINSLPRRPVVSAFTATATPVVREDIQKHLELRDPDIMVSGFDRSNLFFAVRKPGDKFAELVSYLESDPDRSGIVYCSTRKTVDEVSARLNAAGYNALPYHAGLSADERGKNQDGFLYEHVRIIVATNAFGMGIDKSNVRFVIHYNMPMDIEGYYQEAGRAGRDGEPADCLLFYSGQDVVINRWLIDNSKGSAEENDDDENRRRVKARDHARLRVMTAYCTTGDCLREYILRYFGENPPDSCRNCGNCGGGLNVIDVTEEAQKIISCCIRSGERYGAGMIIDILNGRKTDRIVSRGLDRIKTFGISDTRESVLRDIIEKLVQKGHLYVTDDAYPVLKRGLKAEGVLRGFERVTLRARAREESASRPARQEIKTYPFDRALFDSLKALRKEIAEEQALPPYVIFPDSSLTDMCIKMPSGDEEMLNVSGVGQVKLLRYGRRFLEAIKNYAPAASGGSVTAAPAPPPEVEISDEPVTISVIADRINSVLMQTGRKKVTGQKLNEWLIEKGYLFIQTGGDGKNRKVPTDLGVSGGITFHEDVIRGDKVIINKFDRNMQEFIALEINS